MDTIEKVLNEIKDTIKGVIEVESLYVELKSDTYKAVNINGDGVSIHRDFIKNGYSVYLDWEYSWNLKSLFKKESRYKCSLSYFTKGKHLTDDYFNSYDYPITYEIMKLTEELTRIRKYNNLKFIVNGVEELS